MLNELAKATTETSSDPNREVRQRRRSERVPAQEPAVLRWKDHLQLERSLNVTVVNVSHGGVAFSGRERLEKRQMISLETATRTLDCVVRHIRATTSGFYIGAEVLSSSQGRDMLASVKRLAMAKDHS